jgi:hypothetical protein
LAQKLEPAYSNGMDAPTLNGIESATVETSVLPLQRAGASTMKITTIGIDLAKNVFQVHGVDEHGRAVFNKPLKRNQMAA